MCQVADLDAHGLTYETRGRHYPNPALPAFWEAQKRVGPPVGQFGLSPRDRAQMGLAEVRPQSKFELLALPRPASGPTRRRAQHLSLKLADPLQLLLLRPVK